VAADLVAGMAAVDTHPPLAFAPGADETVGEHRSARAGGLGRREAIAVAAVGGGLVVASILAFLLAPSYRHATLPTLALYLAVYTVVSRVEFEVFTGGSVPSELVLLPMLFVLPLRAVPLVVAAGLLLAAGIDAVTRSGSLARLPISLIGACHVVGPVLVLWLAGARSIEWGSWPIYLLALVAQFAVELVAVAAHEWLARRTRPTELIPHLARTQLVDAALAPAGLAIAYSAQQQPLTILLVLPLVGLLTVLARERRARIDNALELSSAYRGTAFLLGDVVEADDAYTGSHSRDVVDLALAVADALGIPTHERQDIEFTALLHDVGKIRIPAEIINKPAALNPGERALIETHTIEGERMLEKVGGRLATVGRIVRSCHERWDGTGYPDGLAAEQIPRPARIVMCCDAFSAMTTNRSYRRALPLEAALDELRANAGTQFDPAVVHALINVVGSGNARRPA
jgi:HD-GYP domain-containing protein (c-di-GMP phosphodiesterase class II)